MSLYGILAPSGPSGFGYASTAEQVTSGLDLRGKTFLVTGSNSGIGQEAVRVLALRGARVLALARDLAKAQQARAKVASSVGAGSELVIPVACDLSEPLSVLSCVDGLRQKGELLDGVIANAGIMALPRLEQKYDVELQFLTNHLGHFLLITGLLSQLSERGRVVLVSSAAHHRAPRGGIEWDNLSGHRGYSPWLAYAQSKLANLLMARALGRRFADTGRRAMAVHPGVIWTPLVRHLPLWLRFLWWFARPIFLKTVEEGAATMTWAAVHAGAEACQGEYLADCNRARSSVHGADLAMAERLWQVSEAWAAGWVG